MRTDVCRSLSLPDADLRDLPLEIAAKTGSIDGVTHGHEPRAHLSDLQTSICAVLLAQACKADAGERVVPMLLALREHLADQRLDYPGSSDGFAFATRNDTPQRPDNHHPSLPDEKLRRDFALDPRAEIERLPRDRQYAVVWARTSNAGKPAEGNALD